MVVLVTWLVNREAILGTISSNRGTVLRTLTGSNRFNRTGFLFPSLYLNNQSIFELIAFILYILKLLLNNDKKECLLYI